MPAIPDCPRCAGEPLDLFQPSERRPELVLALCWACGELYRLEPLARGAGWRVEGPVPVVAGAGAGAGAGA